jgi:prepilin-type N-terminal cleavage/methylation domain-containing protein
MRTGLLARSCRGDGPVGPAFGPRRRRNLSRSGARRAFTLIELLLALTLTAAALVVAFSTFHSISKAWQRGQAMSDGLNRGDYVMDQLHRGLRSAFYPPVKTRRMDYGFLLEDDGEGPEARDALSWVKTGDALLAADSSLAGGTHRVRVSVEKNEDGEWAIVSRAWPPHVNKAFFDPGTLEALPLSRKIVGFDCRVSTNRGDSGWEWQDTWEGYATNVLPLAVELTLYLEPPGPGDEPVRLSRLVEIPLAPHSWNVRSAREEREKEGK